MTAIAAAKEQLQALASKRPALKSVEIIDVSTPAILSRNQCEGPVCLVGSKAYSMTPEQVDAWRKAYRHLDPNGFTGIDIEDGLNVDVVADLCAEDFRERHQELVGQFGLVVCGALLEHVQNPFDAARNVAALLKPGGCLYYLGPWVWGFHPYPDDLWRFSFSGLKALFPDLTWREWWYSGTNKGVGVKIARQSDERLYFQSLVQGEVETVGQIITDRTMSYLNVGAIGQRPV